jgi:hypothetical protein
MSGLAALETPQQQTVRCGADLARKGGGITGMSRAGAMITLSEAEWVIPWFGGTSARAIDRLPVGRCSGGSSSHGRPGMDVAREEHI